MTRSPEAPYGGLPTGTHAFTGQIAGLGFAEGTRVVVGHWTSSPLGAFTDVMVERADGHRVLLAPTAEIGSVVSDLYRFDEVQVVPVTARVSTRSLEVTAGPLHVRATIGGRPPLGRALAAVPSMLQRQRWFSRVTDPIAHAVLDGVRTQGTTANGLRAAYGATDLHLVQDATATWDGEPLGALGPVEPPVRFGFGSTPPEPTLTSITTTIEVPAPDPLTGVIDCWGMGALRDAQTHQADPAAPRQAGAAHTHHDEEHTMSGQPTDHPTSDSDQGHTGVDRTHGTAGAAGAAGSARNAGEQEREQVDATEARMRSMQDAAAEDDQDARVERAQGADAPTETPEVLTERPAGAADDDDQA